MSNAVPLVAVATDLKQLCGQAVHAVARKYVDPLLEISGCLPLLLPAFGASTPIDQVLSSVHGLLFSGSPSNIEPHHYGEALDNPDSPADPARDATTLPLIRAAIARGIPVFGICRGFQEINVALGGALLQQVHRTEGYADHREDESQPLEQQYGPAHEVRAVPGGWLERLVGRPRWQVNSLHGQGIKRLAPGLLPQAYAPDGLVEAYTHAHSSALLLAVQWHPEWHASSNPESIALFRAFGDACRARAAQRNDLQPSARRAHAEAA